MQGNIESLAQTASTSRRPLLHHLNADTTWLLQLPVPQSSSSPRNWFNILIDPWLTGPQSDVASWFSRQWHVVPPALGSIAQVNKLCSDTEGEPAGVDAIVISHEFTDHCHKETLLQCDEKTPVVAAIKAAGLIRKWDHFDTIIETPPFEGDWRKASVEALPSWLSISRVVTKTDAFYYHSAVMITWGEPAECVIYTPHGIHAPSLSSISTADPPISTLALLHGLHDVSIDWGQQLNLGAHNGLAAQKALEAKYWIGTHDEIKKGGGVVSWFLRRKQYTLKDALEKHVEGSEPLEGVVFWELENGETRVLS